MRFTLRRDIRNTPINTTMSHDRRPNGYQSSRRAGSSTGPVACPCCDKPLQVREMAGISIRVCGDCGGLWLPEGAIPTLLQHGPSVLGPLTQEIGLPLGNVEALLAEGQRLECPMCHLPMEGGPYAYNLPERVDHCGLCGGSWIGTGELEAILCYHAHSKGRQSAQRQSPGYGLRG